MPNYYGLTEQTFLKVKQRLKNVGTATLESHSGFTSTESESALLQVVSDAGNGRYTARRRFFDGLQWESYPDLFVFDVNGGALTVGGQYLSTCVGMHEEMPLYATSCCENNPEGSSSSTSQSLSSRSMAYYLLTGCAPSVPDGEGGTDSYTVWINPQPFPETLYIVSQQFWGFTGGSDFDFWKNSLQPWRVDWNESRNVGPPLVLFPQESHWDAEYHPPSNQELPLCVYASYDFVFASSACGIPHLMAWRDDECEVFEQRVGFLGPQGVGNASRVYPEPIYLEYYDLLIVGSPPYGAVFQPRVINRVMDEAGLQVPPPGISSCIPKRLLSDTMTVTLAGASTGYASDYMGAWTLTYQDGLYRSTVGNFTATLGIMASDIPYRPDTDVVMGEFLIFNQTLGGPGDPDGLPLFAAQFPVSSITSCDPLMAYYQYDYIFPQVLQHTLEEN